MKVGEMVKQNIKEIINYCNNIDHNEFDNLLDIKYSKQVFDINFPFCIELDNINNNDNKTHPKCFWTEIYMVRGKRVRVTSQWIKTSIPFFLNYLKSKDIKFDKKIEIPVINKNMKEIKSTKKK